MNDQCNLICGHFMPKVGIVLKLLLNLTLNILNQNYFLNKYSYQNFIEAFS